MHGYIRGLDGLRAFAILWVMFGHVAVASQLEASSAVHKLLNLFASMGWTGVQLFFVISGFLITKILIENKGKPGQLKNFYIRRSLRIFPVYYFTLTIAFIIVPLMGLNLYWLVEDTENQIWFWTYLNNWVRPYTHSKIFPHLWSLAIEEQYYLLWPFVVILLDRKWLIRICMLMIVSAPIFRYLLFYFFEPDTIGVGARAAYNFTFARWDAIALGSLLAVLLGSIEVARWLQKNIMKIFVFSSLLIVLQLFISHTFNAIGEGGFELINQTSSALVFFVLVYYVVTRQQQILVSILEFSALKRVGKYSYAMYIFHLPIMVIWFKYFASEYNFTKDLNVLFQLAFHFTVVFILSYIISYISWHLLEYPILKLKHRFS